MACFLAAGARAQEQTVAIRDTFGDVGLIDMPSARMSPDGEIGLGASAFQNNQRYSLSYQILPWLEGSFRYSGLQNFGAGATYYDRSFAMKLRLWDESEILPAAAIGINDLVGDGIYGGEYLVVSKQFGALDASLGIGWGRLGSSALFRNPLTQISSSFGSRTPWIAGNFSASNDLFHGPTSGLFGGLAWHTPIEGLALIGEYSSDVYNLESTLGNFTPRNQMNFGISYLLHPGIQLGLNWMYGRSIGGSLSFALDPTKEIYSAKLGPEPPRIVVRSTAAQQLALQNFARQNSGKPAPMSRGFAASDAFVDALWRSGDVQDVRISGHALLLLTARSANGSGCLDVARLAQTYDSAITSIVIGTASDGPIRCATSAAPRTDFQAGNFVGDPDTMRFYEQTTPTVLTIDASTPGSETRQAISAVRAALHLQYIKLDAISLLPTEAVVYYTNDHYFFEADAVDRVTRVLMADAPPGVEQFRLIAVVHGVPQTEFDVLRGPLERKASQNQALDATADHHPAPMENPVLSDNESAIYPRFSWAIFPQLREALSNSVNPFGVQLSAGIRAAVELLPGFSIQAEGETSLFDDFNTTPLPASTLPHVRSDFLKYFAQGKTGLSELDARYRFRLAPDVFGIVKLGYLESMFAGGGGEILWRPDNQRWALGVDAYQVQQRDFDRLLGLQPYRGFTGHVSVYYASPWYGLNFAVRAGQYLAGDRGVTLEVTRRFSTGVEIGAFATKTNVSSGRFGEGGFDKGIMIRIPMGWILPTETQDRFDIDLRPFQRDGGQRLYGDASLYEETGRTSEAELRFNDGPTP